jgi:hypothetical protein
VQVVIGVPGIAPAGASMQPAHAGDPKLANVEPAESDKK